MKTLETYFHEIELFKDLQTEYVDFLIGCASSVHFQAGELITKEGAPANHFYVVRHGTVSIDVHDPRRGYIHLLTVGENDVLGWSWLFPPYRWHFDSRARTLIRAVALDGACIRDKCEAEPAFGYEFLKRFSTVMIHRLKVARMQVANVYG